MEATLSSCSTCHGDGGSGAMGDTVRVRYFFGQRLTAVDLADEQAYLVGKQRFHNRHLHGLGVLCGLTAERTGAIAGDAEHTRILRVHRGAAIDCHGREIVVGSDHCLDVGAWYGKRRAKLPASWKETGPHDVWVAVRYRDCPSDPVIAPRDPCGCPSEGCEYARVREGFELDLLTDLDAACTKAVPAGVARAALVDATTDCPDCDGACVGWLILAKLTVTLTANGSTLAVSDISTPDNHPPERLGLLSTAALQALVRALVQQQPEALAAVPTLGAPRADGTLAAPILTLPVNLVADGAGGTAVPLSAVTVHDDLVRIQTLTAAGWKTLVSTTAYDDATASLSVTVGEAFAADGAYRLVVVDHPLAPVADLRLRALATAGRVVRFTASDDAGALAIAHL